MTAPVNAAGTTGLIIDTGPYDFGDYHVVAQALDAEGKELAHADVPFTRERPPWWHSTAGLSAHVMPGWTPMRVAGNVIDIVGRKLYFGAAGLPERITSAGDDILAAPVTLEIRHGDAALPLTPAAAAITVRSASETRVETEGTARGDGFTVATSAFTEYDGLMYFTVTLAPNAGATPTLDKLTLTLHYRPPSAALAHWWSGKQDFRDPRVTNVFRVTDAPGVLFCSNDDARVAREPSLRGSFIPYVLLTGLQRGMAWFAQNDQGWTQRTDVPAVQIIRTANDVRLVLTVIDEPLTLTAPRSFSFGLMPIPVKPLTSCWRTVGMAGYAGPIAPTPSPGTT